MKRNKILFFLLFGVAFLLSGCDVEVDEKDRLVDVEIPTAGRNVLIEDFTGQASTARRLLTLLKTCKRLMELIL